MNIKLWLLVLSFCLSSAGIAQANPTAEVRKTLQAKYDQSDAAYTRGDVPGYLSIYAGDYTGFDDTDEVLVRDKSELERFTHHQFQAKKLAKHSVIQAVSVDGNQATVTVQGSYGGNGDRHRDLWQKVKHHWRLKASHPLD